MTEVEAKKPQETLQDRLAQVVDLLQRRRLGEDGEYRQDGEQGEIYDESQILAELQRKLDELHPADVAHILEALPLEERLTVWQLVKAERDGDILLEVSDAVRETLIADMDDHELLAAAKEMDADELADLAPELPRDVVHELMESLDAQQRERVRSALSYEEDQVGALMDFEMVTIREDVSLEWCCVICAASRSCRATPTSCSWSTTTACSRACSRSSDYWLTIRTNRSRR